MLSDHVRHKVISEFQHLYQHSLEEFVYAHPSLPTGIVTNAKEAMDYMLNVLYPRIQPAVLDVTQLPTIGNVAGDQRIVQEGRGEILSAGVNSDLVNGVLEVLNVGGLAVGSIIHLGNVSVDKTSGFPDGQLYVGAVSVAPNTVTLYEDIGLTTLADLSGLGLIDGPVTTLTNDTINSDNAESWMWAKYDGQVAEQWNKIADQDWGVNSVVQALLDQTQYLYVRKYGTTDYDPITEIPLAGIDAGQHIYGGDLANQNLTLHANNGDDPNIFTGYIQFDDAVRPTRQWNDALGGVDLGEVGMRFATGYFNVLDVGTSSLLLKDDGNFSYIYSTSTNTQIILGNPDGGSTDPLVDDVTNLRTAGDARANNLQADTSVVVGIDSPANALIISNAGAPVAQASIRTQDSAGIYFFDEPFDRVGTIGSDTITITDGVTGETLILDADGDATSSFITSSLGSINFGASNLLTTGDLTAGTGTFDDLAIDDIRIGLTDGRTIETVGLANLSFDSAGGDIQFQKQITVNGNITTPAGTVTGTTLSTTSSRLTLSVATLTTAATFPLTLNLGLNQIRFGDGLIIGLPGAVGGEGVGELYFDDGNAEIFNNATSQSINITTLMSLRDILTRSAGEGGGAIQVDDIIKWDGSKFVGADPDTEIDHDAIANLTGSGGTTAGTLGTDAGHTQFALLGGRTGGQILYGGVANGEELQLRANRLLGALHGFDIQVDAFVPSVDGYDIGASGSEFENIYMDGEVIGLTAETQANFVAIDALTDRAGRIAFNNDDDFLYVNNGATWSKVGHNTFTVTKNQTATAGVGILDPAGFDLPTGMDATECIFQVYQVSTGDLVSLRITVTAGAPSNVVVSADVALETGDYKLIGIQI